MSQALFLNYKFLTTVNNFLSITNTRIIISEENYDVRRNYK